MRIALRTADPIAAYELREILAREELILEVPGDWDGARDFSLEIGHALAERVALDSDCAGLRLTVALTTAGKRTSVQTNGSGLSIRLEPGNRVALSHGSASLPGSGIRRHKYGDEPVAQAPPLARRATEA